MLKKIILGSVILGCVACGGTATKGSSELTVAASFEPSDLRPYTMNEMHAYKVRVQMFDKLIKTDANGNLVPSLATSWEIIDPTTIELKIRQGVTFHNGDPLTVEDIKYSIDTATTVSTLRTTLGIFKSTEIIDDETVRVSLHEPNASALALFTSSSFVMSSKKSMEDPNPESAYNGTGPFKFVEWNRGRNILMERYDDYWDTPAKVQKVNYRIIPEPSVRMIAVETGEVDIAYDIEGADIESARNHPNINYMEQKGSRVDYVGLTMIQPPFDNQKAREAIAWALDVKGMISSVMFGAAEIAGAALSDTVLYSHYIEPRERDIEKAKALLAEAGVAPGTKIDLWTVSGFRQKLAEVAQANLAEVGLDINIKIYEWATYLEGLARGEAPMFLLGWVTNPLDADAGLYPILHSSSKGAAGNDAYYENPEMDRLLDIGRNSNDPEIRAEVYKQAQELVFEDVPFVMLFYFYNNVATTKNVTKFVIDPFSCHELKYVEKK